MYLPVEVFEYFIKTIKTSKYIRVMNNIFSINSKWSLSLCETISHETSKKNIVSEYITQCHIK